MSVDGFDDGFRTMPKLEHVYAARKLDVVAPYVLQERVAGRTFTEQDFFNRFMQLWPFMADQAEATRQIQALSYRDFNVGVGVFALNMESKTYGMIYGANFKQDTTGAKVCAEQIALAKARNFDFQQVLGIVVVGDPQPDAHSGIQAQTLHPCGECRDVFRLASPLVRPNTLVISTPGVDSGIMETHSVQDLLQLHEKGLE